MHIWGRHTLAELLPLGGIGSAKAWRMEACGKTRWLSTRATHVPTDQVDECGIRQRGNRHEGNYYQGSHRLSPVRTGGDRERQPAESPRPRAQRQQTLASLK